MLIPLIGSIHGFKIGYLPLLMFLGWGGNKTTNLGHITRSNVEFCNFGFWTQNCDKFGVAACGKHKQKKGQDGVHSACCVHCLKGRRALFEQALLNRNVFEQPSSKLHEMSRGFIFSQQHRARYHFT